MGSSMKNKSKLIHLSLINDLPNIIKYNVEKSDDDKYQETTAKQIEALQAKLAKANETINNYKFWIIFALFFVADLIVAVLGKGLIWLILFELIPISCAAKAYGQEEALRLITWFKGLVEDCITKIKGLVQ